MTTTKTMGRHAPARVPAPKPSTLQSEASPPIEMGGEDESACAASRSKDQAALSRKPARQLHLGHAVLKRAPVRSVVVPSHHEENHIVPCPGSLQQAAPCAPQAGLVCKRRGVDPVAARASIVGIARTADARWLVFPDAGLVTAPGVLSALALRRSFGRYA